jgi:hypothetical protein
MVEGRRVVDDFCSAVMRYVTGSPWTVGGADVKTDNWAACILAAGHDGDHLADVPGRGLVVFPGPR